MAEGLQQEEDYVIAFKSGNKLVAEQLLPRIPQPVAITTTFKFSYFPVVALVSLVHLAAYWGWRNVVTALVSVYKCAANCKDEKGHIPLHYAAYNGHLEVVKYFVIELLCDPMDYACRQWSTSTLPSTSSERNTVIHHVRTIMARHHFTMLVVMVTSTLPSTSSERNTVIHHVRTMMAIHHFTMLVVMVTSTFAQYLIREEHCSSIM